MNDKAYNALSPQFQSIVRQAASDAHVLMQAKYDARNPNALRQLIAEGAKLQRFPRDVMDAVFKARNEVYAELNESNANWKIMFSDYERFLRDQFQWAALAENSYNQYMAAQTL
jgi:TRAP-type mannitol/chloroaromatic compound transport system substrate-binding protein